MEIVFPKQIWAAYVNRKKFSYLISHTTDRGCVYGWDLAEILRGLSCKPYMLTLRDNGISDCEVDWSLEQDICHSCRERREEEKLRS